MVEMLLCMRKRLSCNGFGGLADARRSGAKAGVVEEERLCDGLPLLRAQRGSRRLH